VGGTYTGNVIGGSPLLTVAWSSSPLFPAGFSHSVNWSSIGATTHSGTETFWDSTRLLATNFSGSHVNNSGTYALHGTWTATNTQNLSTLASGTYSWTFDGEGNWSH
jgi:hypothetical protein